MAVTIAVNRPTIVIVPGSFSGEPLYASVISLLSSHNYEVIFASLPSIVPFRNDTSERKTESGVITAATMEDDAEYIRSILTSLANQGKEIILAAHSYGGFPAAEGCKGLGKFEREKGGVIGLVYLTALVPSEGESLMGMLQDLMGDYVIMDGEFMLLDTKPSAIAIFSDLPLEEATSWVEKMAKHSALCFTGEATYEAWKHIPVTYLLCENDKVLPLWFQKKLLQKLQTESGSKVNDFACSAGHGMSVSAPDKVVDVIRKAAGEVF